MHEVKYKPIGVIHSPFKEAKGMPIQPAGGIPLLDIKSYVPDFDWRNAERIGWLSGKSRNADQEKADGRFQSG